MPAIDVHVTNLSALAPGLDWVVAGRPGSDDRVLMVDAKLSLQRYTQVLTTVLTTVELACACFHYGEGTVGTPSMDRKAG